MDRILFNYTGASMIFCSEWATLSKIFYLPFQKKVSISPGVVQEIFQLQFFVQLANSQHNPNINYVPPKNILSTLGSLYVYILIYIYIHALIIYIYIYCIYIYIYRVYIYIHIQKYIYIYT